MITSSFDLFGRCEFARLTEELASLPFIKVPPTKSNEKFPDKNICAPIQQYLLAALV